MKLKVAGVGIVLALAGVAAAIALGAAGGGISVAPKDAAGVITISGIDGGDPGSPTIDVMSFSWGVSNTFTGSHGGGGGAGKANFQDLSVMKLIDKASPLLAKACATGQHIQTVILNVNRPGGPKGAPYMQYKLDDVFVTSVSHGGWETPSRRRTSPSPTGASSRPTRRRTAAKPRSTSTWTTTAEVIQRRPAPTTGAGR